MNKSVQPQPGNTYVMHSTEPKMIVFKMVDIGHYQVNGQDVRVANHGDLCTPYAISMGPFEYKG